MSNWYILCCRAATLGVIVALSAAVAAQPVITGVTPSTASPGMAVVIEGSGFRDAPSLNIVRVNGVPAYVHYPAAPGVLVATVPAGALTGPVTVQVGPDIAVSPAPLSVVPATPLANALEVQVEAAFQSVHYSVVDSTQPLFRITLDSSINALQSNTYKVLVVTTGLSAAVDVASLMPLTGVPLTSTAVVELPEAASTIVVVGTTDSGTSFSVAGTMVCFTGTTLGVMAEIDPERVSPSPDPFDSELYYQTELVQVGFLGGTQLSAIRGVLEANDVVPAGIMQDIAGPQPAALTVLGDVRGNSLEPPYLREALRLEPSVAYANVNGINDLSAVVPVGETMPQRLVAGGPFPTYTSGTSNGGYNNNTGGFDANGTVSGGVGVDELDLNYRHFFYQTWAAHRLQAWVYANVNPSGGAAPTPPLMAVLDSGHGNGGANAAANAVLNDLPLGRLGATDADGHAFNGILADTGSILTQRTIRIGLFNFVLGAREDRVAITGMTDRLVNSHGTFVALLAAGGGAIVQGLAPNRTVIPYRIFPAVGGASDAACNAAYADVAARQNIAVVNCSFGKQRANNAAAVADAATFAANLNALQANGQIVVYAAGNSGINVNRFSAQVLADARGAAMLNNPLIVIVAATDIPAAVAGTGPVGPEQSWRAPNPPCAPMGGNPFVGTNFGTQVHTSAYGGFETVDMTRAGVMARNYCGGTSWAAPQVSGLLTELVHLDHWTRGVPAAGAARRQRRRQIVEYVLGTGDDLGSITLAAPFINNNAGDGGDNNFGYGRMNAWKATLAVLNGGLSAQASRTAQVIPQPNPGNDTVFQNLPLRNDQATQWYGFEVITSELNAVAWIDGTVLSDAGANAPGPGDAAARARIRAYKGVRSNLSTLRGVRMATDGSSADPGAAAPGPLTAEEQLTGIVPVGTRVNGRGQYVMTFSIRRADLYNGGTPKTFSLRRAGETVSAKPFFNIALDTAKMRGEGGGNNHVTGVSFDDFVFQITVPDYGDAKIEPTAMTMRGPRHENTALEWLGKPNASNLKSVTGEHNASAEAAGGSVAVDVDGVTNRSGFHDRDGRDDGVIFFPLTYAPGNTGRVEFSIGVSDAGDAARYSGTPTGSVYFNLWIDWNADGTWSEDPADREHPLNGVRIRPLNANMWTVVASGAGGTVTALASPDNNVGRFQCVNLPVGAMGCDVIWARARVDYGENAGRNDPRPTFRSLPSLRDPAQPMTMVSTRRSWPTPAPTISAITWNGSARRM